MIIFLNGWGATRNFWPENWQRPACRYIDFTGPEAIAEAEQLIITAGAQERITLVGWSLGGMVALELASRYQQKLAKLVLLSTTACFVQKKGYPNGLRAANIHWLARNLQKDVSKALDDFYRSMFITNETAFLEEQPAPQARLTNLQGLLWGLDYLEHTDLRELLTKIKLPTYIFHGQQDFICPWSAGLFLAEHLSQARIQTFPQCGHAPFFTYPEVYEKVIFTEQE